MSFDFTTLVDRRTCGSVKYNQMLRRNPDVRPGVIPFSMADMDLPMAPALIDGLKHYLDHAILGYTAATPAYLEAVCSWMHRRHGWSIKPAWILPAPTVLNALFIGIRAFSQPGDGVIIQTPVYYPFYRAIGCNGRKVVPNPLRLHEGRYEIDLDQLEQLARRPDNKILLFCSPHNPVGRVWTEAELQAVADICRRHDLIVISDEIHFDLIMPGHRHTVLASIAEDLAERTITCTAPTKSFNLAGMRVANIIIPSQKLRRLYMREAMAHAGHAVNCMGYQACEIAYTQCEDWLDAVLELIWRQHQTVRRFMAERLPQIRVFDLEGTYLQWMDFNALRLDPLALERKLHLEAEVFFDEGYIFGETGVGFERMNLACPEAVLDAALERLAGTLAPV